MADQRHKKRTERMAKELNGYLSPYYIINEKYLGNGKYETIKKPYVRKCYRSAGCKRYSYYKKKSNRQVRKTSHYISKGNWYRKIFDYQWEID